MIPHAHEKGRAYRAPAKSKTTTATRYPHPRTKSTPYLTKLAPRHNPTPARPAVQPVREART